MDGRSLGAIAYEAYGETTEFKNFMGNPMPTWEELPPKIKEAWENAAFKIAMITRPEGKCAGNMKQ